jgi:hypothetical protein
VFASYFIQTIYNAAPNRPVTLIARPALNLPDLRANSACRFHRSRPVKVNPVPQIPDNPKPRTRASFRRRYDELEAHRAALVERLSRLGEAAQRHPGYRRALTLLNETFRREKVAQRLAVLQAAAWLIDVLEKLHSVT